MIVVVKRSKNRLIYKILSFIFIAIMLFFYFMHMENRFNSLQQENKLNKVEENPLALKYENDIATEVEMAIRLLDKKKIREVYILDNFLYFKCDISSDIDAIKIRYKDLLDLNYKNSDIIISVDIKEILEIKYNEE